MRVERRGCFWLVMFAIVLVAVIALVEAFRMSANVLQQKREVRSGATAMPRDLHSPEKQK